MAFTGKSAWSVWRGPSVLRLSCCLVRSDYPARTGGRRRSRAGVRYRLTVLVKGLPLMGVPFIVMTTWSVPAAVGR